MLSGSERSIPKYFAMPFILSGSTRSVAEAVTAIGSKSIQETRSATIIFLTFVIIKSPFINNTKIIITRNSTKVKCYYYPDEDYSSTIDLFSLSFFTIKIPVPIPDIKTARVNAIIIIV